MGFEITLAKIRLHSILLYWRAAKVILGAIVIIAALLLAGSIGFFLWSVVALLTFITILAAASLIFAIRSLWRQSALYITNRRVYIEVHRRPWDVFSTDLYFHNMRDTAYSYHSFLGRIFRYGTLFARNGSEQDNAVGLVAKFIPNPDIVRDFISYVIAIESDNRINALKYTDFFLQRRPKSALATDTDMEKKMLHVVQGVRGITGAVYLTEADRDVLWMTEEERNLGVFEALMRKHVIVATHDEKLRPPAGDIVVQRANRIVFPGVPFPEVPQKDVVSCSPGLKAHQYLATRIEVKGDDATLLIGWN